MKNTLLNMLRPGFMEQQELEKKEESNVSMETVRRNNLSLNSEYPSQDLNFLNSNVFVDEGSNVLIAAPHDMEDAEVIAEAIFANKAVIMMLDELEAGMDQRILDFINGVCYVYGIAPRQLKEEKKFVIDPMHKRSTKSFR
ncbi:cell division protein SepF [Bacillus thuringiensis]|uniref:cell division protein SepF n=1 Tax=Bacillus thuringiensis TaxID=1428 RepID=UPI0021D69B62|nr:cell division protein SepF [Bacillus thuringiensis]MCU7666911.1 cell division protein SepF [Bacillus thuringiensis]